MISTAVCIVRPSKADLNVLAQEIEVLARGTRMVFARVYKQGHDAAQTKREVCAQMGMLVGHYSGYRSNAIGAVKGWREGLKEQRTQLRMRLSSLEAKREKDNEKASTKRRGIISKVTPTPVTRYGSVQAVFAHYKESRYDPRRGGPAGAGSGRGADYPPTHRLTGRRGTFRDNPQTIHILNKLYEFP